MPSSRAWHRLFDAVEMLHSHGQGDFHERLFEASRVLFGDTYHGLEVVKRDGTHSKEADMPWPVARRAELLKRSGEVAPVEHPVFALLMRGEEAPVRLSDLMSRSQLRRTNLYNDLFKPVDIEYQVAIPLLSPESIGAFAIHRSKKDFSDEELVFARLFARHVRLSYETAKRLAGEPPAVPRESAAPTARPQGPKRQRDTRLELAVRERLDRLQGAWSLTKRQTEVLGLVAAGKANKTIAAGLGCAEVTIEFHVTALLRKSGTENRASLIARFWLP